MDGNSKKSEEFQDPDFFNKTKAAIEYELSNLKKLADSINQKRVEAAYLESDLMMTIDSSSWEDITEFIGLASIKKKLDSEL